MEPVKAEDFDHIDEDSVQVHAGDPVEVVVSLRLSSDEAKALNDLAAREGTDAVEIVRTALKDYMSRRAQPAAG